MNTEIVVGSVANIAQSRNVSIAESFLDADVVIVVDVSGSMHAQDSHNGQCRYEVACQELARLQCDLPGKVAVIAFSSYVQFVPGGVPPFMGGGTNLADALKFVQVADGLVRFIIISDGLPDDGQAALSVARQFKSRIDTVYIGPEDDLHGGRRFLEKLAAASGGQFATADRAKELAGTLEKLLLTSG